MNPTPLLPGITTRREIRPEASRLEPGVWIQRLVVLDQLASGDEHVVRSVALRRGMNIVWAPPRAPGRVALFETGVAGHTAGKTTFCRFLRYVLGEGSFADEVARRRIRERLPTGWVLAEVILDGGLWCVARPFAIGAHSFCVEAVGVEGVLSTPSLERQDFDAFRSRLDRIATEGLPTDHFPTSAEPVAWEHLLPWLTRDQECRFSEFTDWRHPGSGSDSPTLASEEKHFLMRSVLGLNSEAEYSELQRNASLVAQKKEAEKEVPLLRHQASVDQRRVERFLGVKLAHPGGGLFKSEARQALETRENELSAEIRDLEELDRGSPLQGKLEEAVVRETEAKGALEEAEWRCSAETAIWKSLDGKARGVQMTGQLSVLPPGRGYCNVPIRLARERGCVLDEPRPIDFEAKRAEKKLSEEVEELKETVSALEELVRERREALARAERDRTSARAELDERSAALKGRLAPLLRELANLQRVGQYVDDAEEAWLLAQKKLETIKQLETAIAESYALQEQARRLQGEILGRLSSTFGNVMKALLGADVEGKVEGSGRTLVLKLERSGERNSAAISTVRLLGFDLAALTFSIEGHGHFPRFLVHDGPREADMAQDIYARLFLYVRSLEQSFEGEPSFQYIVTSTSPPPEEFQSEPWLRMTLGGDSADERFLKLDL